MQYKQIQKSPHYGRIYGYNEAGQKIETLDWIELKVEHEGQTYTIAELLKKQVDNEKTMETLKASYGLLTQKNKDLSGEITTLKIKTDALLTALKKLTAEVARINSSNKGI